MKTPQFNNVRTSSEGFLLEACIVKQKRGRCILTDEEIKHVKYRKSDCERLLLKFKKGIKVSRNTTYSQLKSIENQIKESVSRLEADLKLYSFLVD